ncbi:MAG: hypothetical protein AB1584_09325 [Pseudomonadota bacterium]
MSGYFEALMRASGMPAAEVTQGHKRPAPDAGPASFALEDGDATDQAAASPRALAPAAAPPPAPAVQAPARQASAEAPARRPAPQPAVAGEPAGTRPASQPQPGAVGLHIGQPAPAPAPPVSPPVPALVHPLARAAMDWVARDEPTPVRKDVAAAPLPPVRTPLAEGAGPVRHAALAAPRHEITGDTGARSVAGSGTAAPAAEERVEVTIGAIHLRVEAPAANTVTSGAPQPPAAGAVSPPATAHGSLARRSLRRI